MTVSCCAVSSARRPASSALPGAATADVGASTPTAVATRAAPTASTARERRVIERWGRTVVLRSPAPGPGKGLVPNASQRTVGKRCRQVVEGALVRRRGGFPPSPGAPPPPPPTPARAPPPPRAPPWAG